MKLPILYIVVPCFNEQEVLNDTAIQLTNKIYELIKSKRINNSSRITFVDDGSKDNTWEIIENLSGKNEYIEGIKLSRNYGHQNALIAGLSTILDKCDITITIDADLQDDINTFEEMINLYSNGCQIVYGVRKQRSNDSFFKKITAESYYKILQAIGVNIVYNHADYRLMSKKAVSCLLEYKEANLFLRGIVPTIGLKTGTVEYNRLERKAGETKYPLKRMISFAIDGITSFSIKPIFAISIIGIIMFVISFILAIYYLIGYFRGGTITGWATIVVSLWGIGGLLLFSIGIIGIYIGKIYLETKNRPRFFIERYIENENK